MATRAEVVGEDALKRFTGAPALNRLFDRPERDFGPTPLWWWSGEEVTAERMSWQLHRFAEGGIYNLVVINLAPAGPTFGARADEPSWFSESWWDRFTEACTIAQQLGLKIWFYDQIGFSGANIQGRVTLDHPSATGRRLRYRREVITDGRVQLHGAEELLAAYDATGRRLPVDPRGLIDAADGSSLQLMISAPTAFDYLDTDAVSLLIDQVHGEFERRVPQFLGSVIPGSFQDELPNTNAWTPRLAEEFSRRKGYDLLDHGPALFAGTSGFAEREAAKIRSDYFSVRGALTEEAFFAPLGRWHTDRGLLLGADQSNPARAGFPTQSTQIYTDYFRTHRWYGAVGSDHEGDAKVHSSMAHLYDHPRVWVESFHSSGWGGTLEDTYDWLLPFLRSGGNLYNPHASYFSTVAGWFEWAPPSTDWRQPYWKHYRQFADAVSRICSIMSWGRYDADVAVLHPTANAQAGVAVDLDVAYFDDADLGGAFAAVDHAQHTYLQLCGKNDWFHWQPGALDGAGIAFDVIDDDSVQRAGTDAGVVAVAAMAYRTVILPGVEVLESDTAEQLIKLLDAGGSVVAISPVPVFAAGRDGDDKTVSRLAEHPDLIIADSVSAAIAQLDLADQHVSSDIPLLVRRDGDVGAALVTGAHPNASSHPLRTNGTRWTDYDFDRDRYAGSRQVRINTTVAEAEVWNPATGRRRPIAPEHVDGAAIITVPQDGAPAWILVWREGSADAPASSRPPEPAAGAAPAENQHQPVDGPWTGRLIPTMDNTWGDLARPAGRPLVDPELWHLDARTDDGDWIGTRATFGQTVLIRTSENRAAGENRAGFLDAGQCASIIAGDEPLGDEDWRPYRYSGSRGSERDPIGALGTKGTVPIEFVVSDAPDADGMVSIRTLIRTDHRGPAELLVYAPATKRVSWNGTELPAPDGYLGRLAITVEDPVNVLEYSLSSTGLAAGQPLGSGFALAVPGGYTDRPEYMVIEHGEDAGPVGDGMINFGRRFSLDTAADQAVLVVGAGRAATVRIDGTVVGRQERVEYYDVDSGSDPQFFTHDVTRLMTPGDHLVEITLESTDPADVVLVDLVAQTPSGALVLVSGAGWQCSADGRSASSVISPRPWRPSESCYAVLRPHPLPDADWLRGVAPIGDRSIAIDVSDSPSAQRRSVRVSLPSGSREVRLDSRLPVRATIDGVAVATDGGHIRLEAVLQQPAALELTTEPVAFMPAASFLRGPIMIDCVEAPIELGEWSSIGLGDWSGAVSYTSIVRPPPGASWILDLGDLRGSVDIALDGAVVAEAFCAPFRFTMPAVDGEARLEITVYNTLGPYLQATTPTTWVFGSQLSSGLFGPVSLSPLPEVR